MTAQLPSADAEDLTAYLTASDAWATHGIWRGMQMWRHNTGKEVGVPIEDHFEDDSQILEETAFTIARMALGIPDSPGGFREAIRRLAQATGERPAVSSAATPARWPDGLRVPEIVVSAPSQEQTGHIADLSDRAAAVRERKIRPSARKPGRSKDRGPGLGS